MTPEQQKMVDSKLYTRQGVGEPPVSCVWSNRELDGSCNVCQRRDDPKVILVTLPTMSFRVCGACATLLRSELERTANAQGEQPARINMDSNIASERRSEPAQAKTVRWTKAARELKNHGQEQANLRSVIASEVENIMALCSNSATGRQTHCEHGITTGDTCNLCVEKQKRESGCASVNGSALAVKIADD